MIERVNPRMRTDVENWAVIQVLVEAPLVCAGIVPANFVDSYALNLYHDGRSAV